MLKVNEDAAKLSHCILDDGGRIVRTDQVPWTRLAAPGFEAITYKILNYDLDRGYMVLLNTFDPGSRFRPHKHLGCVEIIMLSGSFFYENGEVRANDYMLEAGGVTHAPASDEGALMIAIFHGPCKLPGRTAGSKSWSESMSSTGWQRLTMPLHTCRLSPIAASSPLHERSSRTRCSGALRPKRQCATLELNSASVRVERSHRPALVMATRGCKEARNAHRRPVYRGGTTQGGLGCDHRSHNRRTLCARMPECNSCKPDALQGKGPGPIGGHQGGI